MALSNVATVAALVVSMRLATESTLRLRCRDLQSPARVSSLVHAVLCTLQLAEDQWGDAVMSAGIFFVLDFFMTYALHKRMPREMVVHHALGAALCLYSSLTGSAEIPNWGLRLTRALILMETTNPLLHTLVLAKKEKLEERIPLVFWTIVKAVFLMQFAAVRIAHLGWVLFELSKMWAITNAYEKLMFGLSSGLWILQWVWMFKLVGAAVK